MCTFTHGRTYARLAGLAGCMGSGRTVRVELFNKQW